MWEFKIDNIILDIREYNYETYLQIQPSGLTVKVIRLFLQTSEDNIEKVKKLKNADILKKKASFKTKEETFESMSVEKFEYHRNNTEAFHIKITLYGEYYIS